LSPTVTSPGLSEIKVHSHCAQEQEDSSKIEKYNTAPITKPLQAQDCHDTSDNSNNNLLSLFDSDDNPGNKSNLSNHKFVHDPVGDALNGDIEDTSAHGDNNNAGSSGDSCIVYVMHGLLVHFLVLCGDRTAYCTDMGLCECGLPFLEPFKFLLVSMRTSDGGLPIR